MTDQPYEEETEHGHYPESPRVSPAVRDVIKAYAEAGNETDLDGWYTGQVKFTPQRQFSPVQSIDAGEIPVQDADDL